MKLRNRTERIVGNIKRKKPEIGFTRHTTRASLKYNKITPKQELSDSSLNKGGSSDDTFIRDIKKDQIQTINTLKGSQINEDALDNANAEIKKEDEGKSGIFLSRITDEDLETSNKDYCYQCPICEEKKSSFAAIVEHRRLVHGIKYIGKSVMHPNLEPNIHDPEKYCQSCKKSFLSVKGYRYHLRLVHFMIMKPTCGDPQNGISPDPNDPNFYCRSCNYTYLSRTIYRRHLVLQHEMKFSELNVKGRRIKNHDVLPEWDNPENYCRSCEFTYKTKARYRVHCKQIHGIKPAVTKYIDRHDPNFHCKECNITLKSKDSLTNHCRYFHPHRQKPNNILNPDVLPDMSEPNNYCKVCKRKYACRNSYRSHLQFMHKMLDIPNFQKKPKDISPDINDPNNYCRSCDKTLMSRSSFRYHLWSIHYIGEQIQEQDSLEPDADNSNSYCCICERNVTNKQKHYRRHCKNIHRMILGPITPQFAYPDAVIDPNSPDFYCAKCDKHLATKSIFKQHLGALHSINPASESFTE